MKALIVAAGEAPSSGLIRERAAESNLTIAADNGISVFYSIGVTPDIIVGDMDSASHDLLKYFTGRGCGFIELPAEKNETDTEIALGIARERGADTVWLLGATGGRLDHTLANLMLLKYALMQKFKLIIEDDAQEITIGCGKFLIKGRPGETVSIFPVNSKARVTADEGLYYPLKKLTLTNAQTRGISNVFQRESALLKTSGPVWVIRRK